MKAKGRRRGEVSFQNIVLRGLAPALLLGLSPVALLANPTGGTVAVGSATIATSGSTLNVNTGSNQTIIDWGHFGIDAGEVTNINQPNSGSTTLNRVTGGNVSAIYGTLNSNGNVILINPNGVLVGAGGVVNTQGSFTASTLDLSNSDFLAGNNHFIGTSTASVVNLGRITSQNSDIFLIAEHVSNNGALTATNGTVGLAAGNDVTLQSAGAGQQRLSVALDSASVVRSGTGVDNQGTIDAVRAELAANGNIYSLAVNNGGIIRATGSAQVNGSVWLTGHGGTVKNTGTIIAKNADGKGGFIETSGDSLSIGGTVLTGKGGRWLVDPADLVIDASLAATAAAALENGTNVDEQATNSITLDSAIAWSGSNGGILTLDAGSGTITLNASITTGGTGGVVLTAGGYTYTSYTYGTYTVPPIAAITYNNGAAINLASTSSLTINGNAYVIVNSLDAFIDAERAGNVYVALGSNVVATHSYTSTPIPSVDYSEGAMSDGLGHTITGFTLVDSTSSWVGLFGRAGWVSHLGLVDASVTGLGGAQIVGSFMATGSGCYDCYVTGSVTATGSATYVGGLAGVDVSILSSHSAATVTTDGARCVGGLVGSTTGSIVNSYVTGNVMAGGAILPDLGGDAILYVGGLVGFVDSGGEIDSNYVTGNVSGSNSYGTKIVIAGGLVGRYGGLAIAWSHATGNVTADVVGSLSFVGGLVGMLGIDEMGYGGASEIPTILTSSYATGNVTAAGGGNAGGLVGNDPQTDDVITTSYATGNVTIHDQGGTLGGLVGVTSGTITLSYAVGHLDNGTGTLTGGISGANYGRGVTESYWNTTSTGVTIATAVDQGAGVQATGLTSDQMTRSASYSSAFNAAWQIADGVANPYLSWQSLVQGGVSGNVGALTVTVNGKAVGVASSTVGNDFYALVVDKALGTGDTVLVSGATASAVRAVVSMGPASARADLVGLVAVSTGTSGTAGLGAGPSFTLPNGSSVTVPNSVFSPGTGVISAPPPSTGTGPSAGGGGPVFGSPSGDSSGGGGVIASSSGVTYTGQ